FGNPSAVSGVQVSIAASGPGGISSGATTVPTASGVATFSGLVLQTAGSYTFTVSSNGLTPATSSGFTISPASAGPLSFVASPSAGTAGQTLPDVQVSVKDGFGNPVSGATVT